MSDLITVEEYKLYLLKALKQIDESNERDLYYSNILLPGASAAFRGFYHNDFQSISRTEYFSVLEPTRKLFPRNVPVSSITSVTVNNEVIDSTSYKLVSADYSVMLYGSLTSLRVPVTPMQWPTGIEHIKIIYVGGQALDRGDKWAIANFIAQIDQSETQVFVSAAGIEEAFTNGLDLDSSFAKILNKYRGPNI